MSASASRSRPARRGYAATPIQIIALVYGAVFLLVGIAGFVPGLTQDVETIAFAGHGSHALLLGVFQVSVLHNIVHLLFGVAGLLTAARVVASRQYLIWGGVAYAALWVYGLFTAQTEEPANFVPVNGADNWLHLVLAVSMILFGLLVGRTRVPRDAGTRPPAREPRI